MKPVKLILSNKQKLIFKYGEAQAKKINDLLKELIKSDAKKGLDTKVVYVEDAASAKSAGVKKIANNSDNEHKRIVDDLYNKHVPAYIVLLGAQDIFPLQQLDNPADDEDQKVPSDLPYACSAPYSRQVQPFTGPTRVVGRIPDLPGKQDKIDYLKIVINNIIGHKPYPADNYYKYFAITAEVWKKSTQLSLQNTFGNHSELINSPNGSSNGQFVPYTKKQLTPMTHFYNCHGNSPDINFYGQRQSNFPIAINSPNLTANIQLGTVIAAECCFGAELIDSAKYGLDSCSISNNYLLQGAIAFMGSSTIAYGPSDSQSLADLITQYFIGSILQGSSSGRALLEARQRFLKECGSSLDPYELKTLAQFYLLGDPSVQPAEGEDAEVKTLSIGNAISNNRNKLFTIGKSLEGSFGKTVKVAKKEAVKHRKEVNAILENTGFSNDEKTSVYKVVPPKTNEASLQKKLMGSSVKFHTYRKHEKKGANVAKYEVLVIKENENEVLGYRTYFSK